MMRHDFMTKWRARRDELARLGAQVDGAMLCDEVLAEVEALLNSEDEALLGLQDAAAHSGYSSDHLRRLHRLGKLPARRDGRRLFFRAGDLPKKPNVVDVRPLPAYDPPAHARRGAPPAPLGSTDG